MLDTIFGGTSSSRLFQEVRERYGLAYSVYSFTSAYQDAGQVGLYVGTRADNLGEAMRVIDGELARLRAEPATAEELARAKENLKGRVLLALESTGARMSRLGSEILAGAPLLALDEVVERIDAVSLGDLEELATELWDPTRLSVAGIGPDEKRFEEALGDAQRGAGCMIRVAVSGAAGRMGSTTCEAVEGAEDMELVARIDPGTGGRARRRAARAAARRAGRLLDPELPRSPTSAPRLRPGCTSSSAPPVSTSRTCAASRVRTSSSRRTSRSARC